MRQSSTLPVGERGGNEPLYPEDNRCNMNRLIFLLLFFFTVNSSFSQDNKEYEVVYYDIGHFLIEGTKVPVSEKESPYDRLPASFKEKVRVPVWNLSKSSAG